MYKFFIRLSLSICYFLLAQFAYADEIKKETWPGEYVAIAQNIEQQKFMPFDDAMTTFQENALTFAGNEKLQAQLYILEQFRWRYDPRTMEAYELFDAEIDAQNATRYDIIRQVFNLTTAEENQGKFDELARKFTELSNQEDLDPGQKIYVAIHLINVYIASSEEHLYLEVIDEVMPIVEEASEEYTAEKLAFYDSINFVYTRLQDWEKAIQSYQKIVEISLEHNYPIASDSHLHTTSVELMREKYYEEAIEVNRIARDLATRSSVLSSQFPPALVCAGIANRMENYGKAAECIALAELYLDDWEILSATFKSQAARAYVNLGNSDMARQYFDSITDKEIAELQPANLGIALQALDAQIAYAEGNYHAAFETYANYDREITEHYDGLVAKATKDLRALTIQKTQALQEVNTALENKTAAQENTVHKMQQYLSGVVFIAILAFALSILLAYQSFIKQRLYSELQTANAALSVSLHERKLMLQEIHHRVKNNLQLIISLLNLQNRRIKDDGPPTGGKRVIREIQGRVHTMSLIHKELYRSEDFESLNVSNMVRDLTSFIVSLFGDETKLDLSLDDITLDFNKAMPVGLITCEVVANCLEHGRSVDEESVIKIDLIREPNQIVLKVSDNGPGFSDDFNPSHSDSLGFLLIQDLCEQMNGEFSFYDCPANLGACFEFVIPMEEGEV